MKSCLGFIITVGAVTCLRSGPYLPSGWRPKGPAFMLPTEVKAEEKHQEKAESEASGSDALREYGLPAIQDIYQAITLQALPDLYTERAFAAENEVVVVETLSVPEKVNTELRSNVIESESVDTTVEAFNPTEAGMSEETVQDIVTTLDVITYEVKERRSEKSVASETETNDSTTTAILDETTEKSEDAVQITAQNVADEDESAILETNTELRIQVDDNVSNRNEINETLEEDVPSKAGEGFREYGPPDAHSDEEKTESGNIDANGSRRRRFSMKFTTNKKH